MRKKERWNIVDAYQYESKERLFDRTRRGGGESCHFDRHFSAEAVKNHRVCMPAVATKRGALTRWMVVLFVGCGSFSDFSRECILLCFGRNEYAKRQKRGKEKVVSARRLEYVQCISCRVNCVLYLSISVSAPTLDCVVFCDISFVLIYIYIYI